MEIREPRPPSLPPEDVGKCTCGCGGTIQRFLHYRQASPRLTYGRSPRMTECRTWVYACTCKQEACAYAWVDAHF